MHSHTPVEEKFAKYRDAKLLSDEVKSEYWLNNAKAFVEEQVKKMPNLNKAKNIIMVSLKREFSGLF
jgi:hypothetical protein